MTVLIVQLIANGIGYFLFLLVTQVKVRSEKAEGSDSLSLLQMQMALINVSYGKPENPVTYFENDTKRIYLLVTMIFLNYICFASLLIMNVLHVR